MIVIQPSDAALNGTVFARQPQVQVQDAASNPVAGVAPVTATVLTGGGSLGGTATVNTNAAGVATFAGLSITGTVGPRSLSFTSTGLTAANSLPIALAAGAPTKMTLAAGDGQDAFIGSTVSTPPAVLVTDVSDNPVSGISVNFAVATGSGSVLPSTAVVTNSAGVAASTSWGCRSSGGREFPHCDRRIRWRHWQSFHLRGQGDWISSRGGWALQLRLWLDYGRHRILLGRQ